MDLVVKSRGGKVSDHTRRVVERKVARMARREPKLQWVEFEFIEAPNPRVDGGHRVEASCRLPRRTFRATAAGANVDALVDQAIARLQRQISDHGGKRRAQLIEGANRVKSGQVLPDQGSPRPTEPGTD
jgi:ribosomal subunit interface protein